ncbi:hypothetical protein RhiirA4_428060 [Rhizophagus irregularis]|uniref:Uncharacterized protein n=1 Tax=Rhizophagus irregularis TaxID=588596 RepID=A0A2I1HBC1_9GLOM|nr:hypothetical protein RhiirA4_428060 [Rhizophagus irregularis]
MTTRSSSTGLQIVVEQCNYDKSAYQQAASSVSSRRPQGGPQLQTLPPNASGNDQQDETSMDIDNNKTDNQQSTRQSSKDKQASNQPPEDLDDQQNGKLSFRTRAPFNKIPVKFQIKDDSDKIKKAKEKEAQKSRMIQILDIPLNYKPYEIRAVFSKYGKIDEDLYTRVKGLY